jgi:hypothetical protein
MKLFTLVALISTLAFAADAPAEAQIVLQSLRQGERARVEAVLGDATLLPLYRGDFTVDVKQRTVSGKFSLTLTAKAPMSEVLLRCTPNATHAAAVVLSNPRINGGKVTVNQTEPSLYRVVMQPALKAGEQATLEFDLKGKIPKLPATGGMGLGEGRGGDYGAYSASDDVVSLVGLLPMMPPAIGGKVLEGPSGIGDLGTAEPSNLVVSVMVPSGWRAVGAGLAMGEVPTGNGQVRFAYGVAAAREMPLLVVKSPKVVTRTFGEVEVEATLLGGDASDAEDVVTHAGKAVELLDRKLGPYPYKTLRVVEMRLVNGAGGMEFPGLVTVSASMLSDSANPFEALGLGPEQAAAAQLMMGGALKAMMKSTLEFTIDHEVAHQYTAMLVGSDPILEPLADEPLTQHLALLILEWRNGKASADALRDAQLKGSYQLHRMMGGDDGKVDRPTSEFESNREYAALIYGKAPLFFDEARKLVGPDAWERSLKAYVEQNRYRFVTAHTFTDLVAKQNGGQARRLEALRKRWWEEAHGDEDIGQFDLEKMLTGSGMLGGGATDKQSAEAFKEFERAMKALSGE